MVQAFSDILIYIYRAQAASDTISHLPSVPNKITENQKRLQKKMHACGDIGKASPFLSSPNLAGLSTAVGFHHTPRKT